MNSTKEKVVWITGASSGIGKAMAHKWSQLGYKVVLSARRQELLKAIAMGIKDSGGEALVIPVDIMEDTSIEKAVQQIITSLGRLAVVVANAGFGLIGSIDKLTAKDWNRQLQGNVTGLALTVKYALPYLEKTNGRIGLVGSIAAYLPNPYVGAYGASKAAVNSIGKTLQVELKNSGVSCTTLHPGFVVSEIARVDNDGVWHPDRPDPRPPNLMCPTDKARMVLVRAILTLNCIYVFTGHRSILVWLQRWFPGLVRTIISKGPKPEL